MSICSRAFGQVELPELPYAQDALEPYISGEVSDSLDSQVFRPCGKPSFFYLLGALCSTRPPLRLARQSRSDHLFRDFSIFPTTKTRVNVNFVSGKARRNLRREKRAPQSVKQEPHFYWPHIGALKKAQAKSQGTSSLVHKPPTAVPLSFFCRTTSCMCGQSQPSCREFGGACCKNVRFFVFGCTCTMRIKTNPASRPPLH